MDNPPFRRRGRRSPLRRRAARTAGRSPRGRQDARSTPSGGVSPPCRFRRRRQDARGAWRERPRPGTGRLGRPAAPADEEAFAAALGPANPTRFGLPRRFTMGVKTERHSLKNLRVLFNADVNRKNAVSGTRLVHGEISIAECGLRNADCGLRISDCLWHGAKPKALSLSEGGSPSLAHFAREVRTDRIRICVCVSRAACCA